MDIPSHGPSSSSGSWLAEDGAARDPERGVKCWGGSTAAMHHGPWGASRAPVIIFHRGQLLRMRGMPIYQKHTALPLTLCPSFTLTFSQICASSLSLSLSISLFLDQRTLPVCLQGLIDSVTVGSCAFFLWVCLRLCSTVSFSL